MPHLEVRSSDVAGVWYVRLPTWPWQYARADEEREALVGRLTDRAPCRRLWLSDSPDDTHGQWQVLSPDQALSAVGSGLDYGDWVVLFFERAPDDSSLPPAPSYPKTPAGARETLVEYGAAAAIWSWLDDAEWLVVVAAA
jgi:hypothetical protein